MDPPAAQGITLNGVPSIPTLSNGSPMVNVYSLGLSGKAEDTNRTVHLLPSILYSKVLEELRNISFISDIPAERLWSFVTM